MLRVSDLTVSFGQSKVLSGVSFEIGAGQVVGIIGTNGSGKTTLLNTLSGFVRQDSGEIILNNKPIQNAMPHVRAQRGLGRVFQNIGIFRDMTVSENILLALESKLSFVDACLPSPSRLKAFQEKIDQCLSAVSLLDKKSARAGSLSGGQMRLLEIARIVALDSELLLLDEPTAGVAPKLKDEVIGAIRSMAERGKTIVIVEHDMNFINSLVSRILVLEQGRVYMDDTPSSVMESPKLREIYFGSHS